MIATKLQSDPGDDYETAGASCGFCGGPMPCSCPPPMSEEEMDRMRAEDERLRNKCDPR